MHYILELSPLWKYYCTGIWGLHWELWQQPHLIWGFACIFTILWGQNWCSGILMYPVNCLDFLRKWNTWETGSILTSGEGEAGHSYWRRTSEMILPWVWPFWLEWAKREASCGGKFFHIFWKKFFMATGDRKLMFLQLDFSTPTRDGLGRKRRKTMLNFMGQFGAVFCRPCVFGLHSYHLLHIV